MLPGEMNITIQAAHVSAGSNLPVSRIVIHDEEVPVSNTSARSVANYFATTGSGGSAHYVVDSGSVEHCVSEEAIAWHAPPNPGSLGIEHNGYATFSRSDWLLGQELLTLQRSAILCATLCARHQVPAVWLSVSDLLAGKRGITSHNNVSEAWHQSEHWDPGPNFPSDLYIQMVTAALGGAVTSDIGDSPVSNIWPIIGGTDPKSTPYLTALTHPVHVGVVRALLGQAKVPLVAVPARGGPWDYVDANTVEWFQTQHQLAADGIVGPQTLIRLIGCQPATT